MREKRAAHAMVFINGHIVVAGGISEDCGILSTCELYSVEEDEWSPIAPLNVPAMNASLCAFGESYLFKFGGKRSEETLNNNIERYSFDSDCWEIMSFKSSGISQLPSSSCSVQINNREMLLFGGTFKSYSEKTGVIYRVVLGEGDKEICLELMSNELPTAEGFWVQQPILHNGSGICYLIYCIIISSYGEEG